MAKKKSKTTKSKKTPAATALPLFYQKPMPLDAKKHANLSLKKNFGFNFTQEVNAVPVNMIEMPQICHFYPIAFSPDENATPVAILGLRDKENLFVEHDGGWDMNTSYIPAYIRRYPFIFSEIPDTDQLTLCFDNMPEVIQKGDEQKFFDDDGAPSKLAQEALNFCKSYHAAAQQTLEFSRFINELGILTEQEAQINVAGNRRIKFSGFRVIDREKFFDLDDKALGELHRKGWLAAIYAHYFTLPPNPELLSMQWQNLTRLLNKRLEQEAA